MRLILFFNLFFFSINILAQDSIIIELQNQFESAEEKEALEIGIQLFEYYLGKEKFEDAVLVAMEMRENAEDIDDPLMEALALNYEAKALMQFKDKRFKNRTRAIKRIRKSQRIMRKNDLDDEALKESNKQLLLVVTGVGEIKTDIKNFQEKLEITLDSIEPVIAEMEEPEDIFEIKIDNPFQKEKDRETEKKAERQIRGGAKMKRFDMQAEKLVQQILNVNRKSFELKKKRRNDVQLNGLVDTIVLPSLDDLEDLSLVLDIEKKKIENDLEKEATKINRMKTVDVKEELLLAHYKNKYDSLSYLHSMDSINLVQQDLELKQQQAKLAQQETRRTLSLITTIGSLILLLLILFGYFRQRKNNKLLSEKNQEIQKERNRSDDLLLNILPLKVADELKQYGAAQAHKYENVSVLFTDFKNFSSIAEKLTPEALVAELDYCFKAFDNIIDKHGLEKIKTIGDAYMCAGGLPTPNEENAKLAVHAALEIQTFLEDWKHQKIEKQEPYFEARIGIHTGAIVAGVVGTKKFAYDIWGDTVNIAARMESSGQSGKVNISGKTYELVKDNFQCTFRGKIDAKNKGEIEMYFVENENVLVA